MLKLQFELEYQKINLVNRWETVATDSKNYLVARFDTLSDDWTMPITAIFTNDKDEQPYAVVVGADSTLESNECYIPWEVLKDESNVHVSAYCGNLHTTVTAAFHVYKSGYADGETPSPPSPTVYDAIMQAITNLQNDKQDKLAAGENITIENNEISALDTNNYNDLSNRPQINGVTLSGNKTDDDLGVQSKIDNLHKLSSDLVDDTNKTNKFVSTSDKASWNAKYDKPNGGIPKTDLDSNVQASLNKADTAIQDISGKADKATTLSGYGITNAYTKAEVDAKLSSVYRYKGTVATYQDLPSTGLTSGDVYNVEADGNNYAWTGTVWDKLGGDIDLSGYQTKIDSSNKLSSDLVDDTNQTNKFVTDTDKTNWNNKLSSANGAVKTLNIDNGAITLEKIGTGVIDSTLSTQGAAAEAKKTGDVKNAAEINRNNISEIVEIQNSFDPYSSLDLIGLRTATGAEVSSDTLWSTGFIYLGTGYTHVVLNYTAYKACFYTASQTHISTNEANSTAYAIPDTAVYCRFSFKKASVSFNVSDLKITAKVGSSQPTTTKPFILREENIKIPAVEAQSIVNDNNSLYVIDFKNRLYVRGGQGWANNPTRLGSQAVIKSVNNIKLTISAGYLLSCTFFSSAVASVENETGRISGWVSETVIEKGQYFIINIKKADESAISPSEADNLNISYDDTELYNHMSALENLENNSSLLTWEIGSIYQSTGTNYDENHYAIRTPSSKKIHLAANTVVKSTNPDIISVFAFEYDAAGTFVARHGTTGNKTVTLPNEGYYRVAVLKAYNGTEITENTISLYSADTAILGQTLNELLQPFTTYSRGVKGEKIDLKRQTYEIQQMPYNLPSSGVVGIISRQDFAIYNGVLFQLYDSDYVVLINLSDGTRIAGYEISCAHGNSCQFSNEFYSENDTYPLLYCFGYGDNKVYVNRVTDSGTTLVRTYKLDTEGYRFSGGIDCINNRLVTIHYHLNYSSIATDNYNIVTVWDLNKTTQNGDGTLTPEIIKQTAIDFIPTIQGCKWFKDRLFINNGYYPEGRNFPVNIKAMTTDGTITTLIDDLPVSVSQSEGEGIDFYYQNGKYTMYMSTYSLYRVVFSE